MENADVGFMNTSGRHGLPKMNQPVIDTLEQSLS